MLSVIIPTHNRRNDLNILLGQIKNQTLAMDVTINIIVVVDGSTDGTLEILYDKYPEVHIVHGDGTWWYTKSMNEGFKHALDKLSSEFILTLNDDVELASDYLYQICTLAETSNYTNIIGSLGITNKPPFRVVTSGQKIRNHWLDLYQNHLPFLSKVDPKQLTGLHPSVILPGRGMLIPGAILQNLNMFDGKFKQYHSDGDFTRRALETGYHVRISWDTKIYVNLEKTSNTTSFLNTSFWLLIKSFFNPVSRNYLPDNAKLFWRHGSKLYFPVKMILFFVVSFKNLVFKKKYFK